MWALRRRTVRVLLAAPTHPALALLPGLLQPAPQSAMVHGHGVPIARPSAIDPLLKEMLCEGLHGAGRVAPAFRGNGLEGLGGYSRASVVRRYALGRRVRWLLWLLIGCPGCARWLLWLLGEVLDEGVADNGG